MPVVIFEYTDNLKIASQTESFLLDLHNTLVDIIKTDLESCKSIITCHADYVVGDGNKDNAFIQIAIKMLPGRDEDTKNRLGNAVLAQIKQIFAEEIDRLNTQLRVSLIDTDIEHYYGLHE